MIRLGALALSASALLSCSDDPPGSKPADLAVADALFRAIDAQRRPERASITMVELVEALPAEASYEVLNERFDAIFAQMHRATRRDLPQLREAFAGLRHQPQIIHVLSSRYGESEPDSADRTSIVAFLGELQRPDAFSLLRDIAWSDLPPARTSPEHGPTDRDLAKLLQAKAIHGIAFIRDSDGEIVEACETELLRVMSSHPARYVRVAAIDAYMWNRGDSPDAAAILYDHLPAEYHEFVERPRFARGVNRESFEARLDAWRERFGRR